MSYNEYTNIFLKAQDIGMYHMIVFDVVNSRSILPQERALLQNKFIKLTELVFNHLVNLEKKLGKDIILKENNFYRVWETKKENIGYLMDPILFGDCIGFTIYRDSLDKRIIVDIFNMYKKQLGIEVEFHVTDGYYETNDYSLGNKKYFRGYCFQFLEAYHKSEAKQNLKK